MNIAKNILNKFPKLKRFIKFCIAIIYVAFSFQKKSSGNIKKISPNDQYEYFFGYYDKCPWDMDDNNIIFLKVKCAYKDPAPKEEAYIMIYNSVNDTYNELDSTVTWNTQQGCMLQWLGPDYNSNIIYNSYLENKYCSVILNIKTKEKKVLPLPIYDVTKDGKIALSLDFSRLHRLRPGYGYSNIEDYTKNDKIPNTPCIWKMNLESGECFCLLKYKDIYEFEKNETMVGAEHKINHIMINPSGTRFMFLHRWFKNGKKYTRLLTCDMNGKNLYNLSDEEFVSHCCWKNDNEILAYERKNNVDGYYLMKDQTNKYQHMWTFIKQDGHPTYSNDKKRILADTYPDKQRISKIYILDENDLNEEKIIAKVYSPLKYNDDTRCDLHPRWSRNNKKICFDGVFEGKRGLYYIEI